MQRRLSMLVSGVVCFAILLIALRFTLGIVQASAADIVSFDDVEPEYVAIVFGAGLKADGSLSDILHDRVQTGIDLYNAKKVDVLLFSGDNGQVSHDEVNAMRRFALDSGVLAEDIFLDHAGFDTYDTVYRARNVFGITQAILVTQEYHLPRALYLANAMGISAQGVSADRQQYLGAFSRNARELLADLKAVIDVTLHVSSKYGGPAIDIFGDGRSTWDEE